MEVKVEPAPADRCSKTIDETRGIGCPYSNAVAIIYDAVAVDILILDVTRLNGSPTLFG